MHIPSRHEEHTTPPSPKPQPPPFPVLALGASAGGIKALQTFFDAIPPDTGMAFVVILHLSPDYESNLAHILQHRTRMPVAQVTQTTALAPNHVYVIPPHKHLAVQDQHLHLLEPQQPSGKRLAVDLCFRTLAASCGPRAIAVVLSGTDGDGGIGIKHVKEQGGLTLAQDPDEAEFDSMPRGAVATGMVDWVLPVGEMPPRLLAFLDNEARMHVPPETPPETSEAPPETSPVTLEEEADAVNSGGPVLIQQTPSLTDEDALVEVLRYVRMQTGHDFAHYKRATILRRVARRLQVNLMEDIPSYLAFLRAHPAEVTALLHDLLISVTNFFRDKEAFAALESHIPQLFADKTAEDQVRVWVVACATGEEAYSVAMLLSEHAARLETPPAIQVFATDLSEDVVAIARTGVYPATIEADVSEERLRRFFHKEAGRYRVKKELRERVLFSAHDILQSSPFSRLDLVTCRNLLIYLKREAQEALFDLFHFALRPGGLLFLGSSENLDDSHALFASLDKRYRLFVRRSLPRSSVPLSALNLVSAPRSLRAAPAQLREWVPAGKLQPLSEQTPGERRGQVFGNMHLTLLERFAPPSVVINSDGDIVHLTEHAGEYLQVAGGEISNNLLKMVHPALRLELRTALFRANKDNEEVSVQGVALEVNGVPRLLNLHVRPARKGEGSEGFTLVVFERLPDAEETTSLVPRVSEPLAPHLEAEVQHLKEQLGSSVEQYEASVEELRAANEELQAVNEEMRSTAEELETSKEELQSVNEELTTVNTELKSRVEELSRSNSDLQNLMASTEIGTIFLDRQLRIQWFTPSAQELFSLIPTDEGRPLSDLTHKLHYPALADDAARVLRDLRSHEREVGSEGRWFLARILPYRTLEDRIDGVVLTFVEITARKQAEEALRASEERYRLAVEGALDYAIILYDAQGRCTGWSRGASRIFGYAEDEALGQPTGFVFTPEDRAAGVPDAERETARREGRVEDERWHLRKDGSRFYASGVMMPLWGEAGVVRGYVKVARDLTEQRQMEVALRASEERYRLTVENIHDYAIFTLDTQGYITSWNEGARRVKGYEAHEVLGQHLRLFYTPEDRQNHKPEHEMEHAAATGRNEDESWRVRKDGTRFWVNEIMTAMRDETGALWGFVKISRDLTERRNAEEEHLAFERETTLLAERNRMAQELHDTLAQGFTGIKMQLDVAQAALEATPAEAPEGLQRIQRAREIAQQSQVEARRSIRALRSPLLEKSTLPDALQRLVADMAGGPQVIIRVAGTPVALSALVENDVYRIGQEALTNALRHSEAQQIVLTLTYFAEQVHLTVHDDGRGFDPQAGRAGFGVTGMQERAQRQGAHLELTSQPGQGTQVTLMLPLKTPLHPGPTTTKE